MPIEANSHPFNGTAIPQFLLHQPITTNLNNIRGNHDFAVTEGGLKMDLPWNTTRPNMPEIQENKHVCIFIKNIDTAVLIFTL